MHLGRQLALPDTPAAYDVCNLSFQSSLIIVSLPHVR